MNKVLISLLFGIAVIGLAITANAETKAFSNVRKVTIEFGQPAPPVQHSAATSPASRRWTGWQPYPYPDTVSTRLNRAALKLDVAADKLTRVSNAAENAASQALNQANNLQRLLDRWLPWIIGAFLALAALFAILAIGSTAGWWRPWHVNVTQTNAMPATVTPAPAQSTAHAKSDPPATGHKVITATISIPEGMETGVKWRLVVEKNGEPKSTE